MTASHQEPIPGSTHERKSEPTSATNPTPAPDMQSIVKRSRKNFLHLQPTEILQLQRSVGNRAMQRIVESERAASTLQRQPTQKPSKVGALNRPNIDNQHESRYQELIGDLQQNPKAESLFSFDEYKGFNKEFEHHKRRQGGAQTYSEVFEASKLIKQKENPYYQPGFSFDPQVAQEHWDKLMKRIEPIQDLNTGEFKSLMAYYITALSQNNQKKAGFVLMKIIDYLDTLSGFKVSRAETKANQELSNEIGDPDISAFQEESAKFSPKHGQLWSKLNKYIAYETAKQKKGVSLESTLGGKLFDGLNFGTTGSVLGPQWTSLSAHYVNGLSGTVHAHAFRGAVTRSVFSSTEWPRVQLMLESGQIKKLIIHNYDFDKKDHTTLVDDKKPTVITKDNYKDGTLKFLDKDTDTDMKQFWGDQTVAHESEEKRNKKAKKLRNKSKNLP